MRNEGRLGWGRLIETEWQKYRLRMRWGRVFLDSEEKGKANGVLSFLHSR